MTQFEPQDLDKVGTSQTPTPPTVAPRPSTSRSASAGYALVPQSFMVKAQKRLATLEEKVKLMERRVKPCAGNKI